jgi:hypothetical protein
MKLYQLADTIDVYEDHAGWWMVVSDDMEDELAGPFEKKEEAEQWIKDNSGARQ